MPVPVLRRPSILLVVRPHDAEVITLKFLSTQLTMARSEVGLYSTACTCTVLFAVCTENHGSQATRLHKYSNYYIVAVTDFCSTSCNFVDDWLRRAPHSGYLGGYLGRYDEMVRTWTVCSILVGIFPVVRLRRTPLSCFICGHGERKSSKI